MRFSFILFSCLFIFSCKSDRPKGILSEEKMSKVLWDVMRADELALYQNGLDSTLNPYSKNIRYYQSILSVHQITAEEYERSFNFYQSNPALLKIVLDSVRSYSNKAVLEVQPVLIK